MIASRGELVVADAGRSTHRVHTADDRTVSEGASTNGPPRACGDWLVVPDGAVSIRDGTEVSSPGAGTRSYDCVGATSEAIVMPHRVIVPNGEEWRPRRGSLDLVDGWLANSIASQAGTVVAGYSGSEPKAATIPTVRTPVRETHVLDDVGKAHRDAAFNDCTVAAGAVCVGYSDDYIAVGDSNEPGLTLLPLHDGVRALFVADATGFTDGRPFAAPSPASSRT